MPRLLLYVRYAGFSMGHSLSEALPACMLWLLARWLHRRSRAYSLRRCCAVSAVALCVVSMGSMSATMRDLILLPRKEKRVFVVLLTKRPFCRPSSLMSVSKSNMSCSPLKKAFLILPVLRSSRAAPRTSCTCRPMRGRKRR